MTLPLEKTLSQVRDDVLERLFMAESAAHNQSIHRQVEQAIRRAHRKYYFAVEWQGIRRRGEFELSEGVREYDFPDTTEIGQIGEVWVEDEDSRPCVLQQGSTPYMRHATEQRDSTPRFYEFIDGGITIYPAPDSNWTTLGFDYQLREPPLVSDSERMVVDSELVIQQSVIYMKSVLGLPGVPEDKVELREYLMEIKSQQAQYRQVQGASYGLRPQYAQRWQRCASNYNYKSASYGRMGNRNVDQQGYARGNW